MSSKTKPINFGIAPSEAWPHFADDEIAAVSDVLRSGKVNQWTGERVKKFEAAMAARIGAPYAVALANGSLALEVALRALGVGPRDEVIVTPASFVASASCVRMVGATPVFADVESDSQNISAATVEPHITPATRAIIAVHLAGWPVDMAPLMALAEQHGITVIEDCAQSIGALIDGKPAGSFGHAAAFSFCQDKIISTGGEGGMALFRDQDSFKRAWSLKDHGKGFDLMQTPGDTRGFRFVHEAVGTNYRMTEMQAAIGLLQLAKLDVWLETRAANAAIWRYALTDCAALRLPEPPTHMSHANYKLTAFLRPDALKPGISRDDVLAALIEGGLRAFSGFCPEIYLEKAFADLEIGVRPSAHDLGQWSLMFEIHPTIDQDALKARAVHARSLIDSFQI